MLDNPTLGELYDWVLRCEEELSQLKSAFPEVLAADRNRLVASLRCCRVSLELRVRHRRGKAPDVSRTDIGSNPARQ